MSFKISFLLIGIGFPAKILSKDIFKCLLFDIVKMRMRSHYINIFYTICDEDISLIYDCIKRSRSTLYCCKQTDLSKSKAIIKRAYVNLELSNPKIILQNGFSAAKDWIKKHYFQQLCLAKIYQKIHFDN
jgi:hypothetical protein